MKISYDAETDAVNIKFQEGKYGVSEEIVPGFIFDLTKDGRVISIEILEASKKMPEESAKKVEVNLAAV